MPHRMIRHLYCIMTGWLPVTMCTLGLNVCCLLYRSYRSIGDETFIRAFETATLGYEEWTHEVFHIAHHKQPLPLTPYITTSPNTHTHTHSLHHHFTQHTHTPTLPPSLYLQAHLRMAWNYLTLHGKEKATPIIKYKGHAHYFYSQRCYYDVCICTGRGYDTTLTRTMGK